MQFGAKRAMTQNEMKKSKRTKNKITKIVLIVLALLSLLYMAWQFARAPEGFWNGTYKPPLMMSNNKNQPVFDSYIEYRERELVVPGDEIMKTQPTSEALYPLIRQESITTEATFLPYFEQRKSLGIFVVTAYCSCPKCCGEWSSEHPSRKGTDYVQKTASGTVPAPNRTIAADWTILPKGTKVYINEKEYIVEDRGGGIIGASIDIYFDSHEEALQFGRQKLEVFIDRKEGGIGCQQLE